MMMKFKKLFLGLATMTALFTGGCSQAKKQSEPVLTKTAAIKKAQQTFKSGQAKQLIDLSTDTASQVITSSYTFGGNPTVFHLNYQTQVKDKNNNIEEWISNTNKTYINGQSNWYYSDLKQMSGHSYADLLDAIMNNNLLMNPPQKLVNAYKMKRSGNTYTLTATITDPKIMREAAEPILLTNTQSQRQYPTYHKLVKAGKYKKMDVKLVIKNQKLATFNYKVNLQIGKMFQMNIGQSYANMRSQDFLKIPNNVLTAKPLPKQKK
ncbi:hypothetical protein F5ESL0228_07425 [Lactobacillus sp. ESL0228]|nr:hypothetical protein F5ESL0228_07425 [Lactobacillus sp. ESL0228]